MVFSERMRITFYIGIIGLILFFVGFFGGKFGGKQLLKGFFSTGDIRLSILFTPSHEFFNTYQKINSYNEFDRLSGYYAMVDNNYINDDFLMKRYELEESEILKRTIIWILGFSKNKETISSFYSSIYNKSELRIKEEIMRSVSRLGYNKLEEFKSTVD